MLAVILIHSENKEFPSLYELYFIKEHIYIFERCLWIHLAISLQQLIEVFGRHGEKTLIIKAHIEDALYWNSLLQESINRKPQQ